MSAVRVEHGDCLHVMQRMADAGILVDGVVTDPPYHLASIVSRLGSAGAAPIQSKQTGAYARSSAGFMGQQWDGGDIAFRVETWRKVFAVMKPGAHLIAFSATRTYHRMVCAIEDAGFEIRDMVPWIYGTGFPKSHEPALHFEKGLCDEITVKGQGTVWRYRDGGEPMAVEPPFRSELANEWAGWGSALKPAIEPVVLARKPMIGSIPANLEIFGTGGLNIDACRVPIDASERFDGGGQSRNGVNVSTHHEGWRRPWMEDPAAVAAHQARLQAGVDHARANGRFPANLAHDGSPEVLEAFAEYGERGAQAPVFKRNGDKFRSVYGEFGGDVDEAGSTFRGDTGTAARFFYSSKATEGERVYRCRECGAHTLGKPGCGHDDLASHPTVKPIDLMRWYLRMIIPPGGLVLDPFAGTGTTGAAAVAEGMQALLIEQSDDYVADICVRLGLDRETVTRAAVKARPVAQLDAGPLFSLQ